MSLGQRSLSDVEKVIAHAKLDRSDLLGETQILHFSTEDHLAGVKLLEVDPEMAQSLEDGQQLVFR